MTYELAKELKEAAYKSVQRREAPHDLSPSGLYVALLFAVVLALVWLTTR